MRWAGERRRLKTINFPIGECDQAENPFKHANDLVSHFAVVISARSKSRFLNERQGLT